MRKFFKYAIRRQGDGSYAIIMKDLDTNRLTIHSSYDTFDEANDELEALNSHPSQTDTIRTVEYIRKLIHKV